MLISNTKTVKTGKILRESINSCCDDNKQKQPSSILTEPFWEWLCLPWNSTIYWCNQTFAQLIKHTTSYFVMALRYFTSLISYFLCTVNVPSQKPFWTAIKSKFIILLYNFWCPLDQKKTIKRQELKNSIFWVYFRKLEKNIFGWKLSWKDTRERPSIGSLISK